MSILSEETLRDIVKSVISTMNEDKIMEKKQNVEVKRDKEECNECIGNITSDEYTKKILVDNPKDMNSLQLFRDSTPARIGVGRSGDRPLTETLIRFRADHAAAIDSVFSEVDEKLLDELKLLKLKSKVDNKDEHITRPDLGRDLDDESVKLLREKCIKNPQVQVIVSDGLSSKAIEANIKDVLPAFLQGLSVYGIKVGTPVFVKYGRVGAMDAIGEESGADAAILFVGERPGLATAESMSAYMVYHPKRDMNESDRTVLSNIHKGGTPPVEAGAHIATLMKRILDEKASGVNMKK